MTNIIINRKNRTIVITKSFERKASKYGSDEYRELLQAQQENVGFKVVVKSSTRKPSIASKVTLNDMIKYIESHDDENKSIMEAFDKVRFTKERNKVNGKEIVTKHSFGKVKKWFFEQYPEVA